MISSFPLISSKIRFCIIFVFDDKATIELCLHLEMEKDDEPGHIIYEVYKRVIGICESSCRDLVSTIALGKIREDRRSLQTNLKIEMTQELNKINVRLQKVVIAPSIRFPQEVENALKREMEIMLQKRAVLAEENHKNEIMVRAAETEAENRTRLATADARNIQRVGIALDGNRSEAARYILLMRFLHEMSRLDNSAAKDNVHKPYLELLRELMTDIEPVVIKQDPKTTPNSSSRGAFTSLNVAEKGLTAPELRIFGIVDICEVVEKS